VSGGPQKSALVSGLRIGHVTDPAARTGCTVLLGPFRAAVEVSGMATGTRELEVLSPLQLAPRADAILLSGGSAFGLAAADGVVRWIAERGGGFDTGSARVPIVPAAVLYDLGVGSADIRPDAAMGYAACAAAAARPPAEGAVGAGTGATVGKALGFDAASRGGFGCSNVEVAGFVLTAVAAVNAFGDVLGADGAVVAGARSGNGGFARAAAVLRRSETLDWGAVPNGRTRGADAGDAPVTGVNTTLAAIVTDAPLDRVALRALARMAGTALARRIEPVHTPFDGDVVFAASLAPEPRVAPPMTLLALGAAAAYALGDAIERAVLA
jgi:L-aminopeptidase/D-esterase-like protein